MPLDTLIENYYFDHVDQLDADKRFHFASRLAAWHNNPRALALLDVLRPDYVKSHDEMLADIQTLLVHPPAAKINALAARQPYFTAYPELRGRIMALFRVRHLRDIYGIDMTAAFRELVPLNDLYALADTLTEDKDAIKVLSTYAINYIFLVRGILYPLSEPSDLAPFLRRVNELGTSYNTTEATDIQLLIYLYTHCIIGASNFYLAPVEGSEKEMYTAMLAELESVISQQYDAINLDNKFEFLVCCRLLGYQSFLTERIHAEARQSISQDGAFLVDRLNQNAQSDKTSLSDSEHRNVLFILSQRPYHATTKR